MCNTLLQSDALIEYYHNTFFNISLILYNSRRLEASLERKETLWKDLERRYVISKNRGGQ